MTTLIKKSIKKSIKLKNIPRLYLFFLLLFFPVILYPYDVAFEYSLLSKSVVPLADLNDLQPIMGLIANKPYVLIGDSTHGTNEFYQQRVNLSKRLIQERNFRLIVLEGDLPNIHLINQYVQSLIPLTAMQVLNVFNPQGAWLWNNYVTLNFIRWLKKYNAELPEGEQKVTLHGIDIYSFDRSRMAVIDYLQWLSPLASQQARQRYNCFSRFNNNLHNYGKTIAGNIGLSCESAVLEQFRDFSLCRFPCPESNPEINHAEFFYAQENARIVKNTEKSFRIQYLTGRDSDSWNMRDWHMMESFLAVFDSLDKPKTIVWAHNSHLGDARATQMRENGMLNLGQLMRQKFRQDVFSIGLLTYKGVVVAADDWNSPVEIKRLLIAHPDSNEALLHSLGLPSFMLDLHQLPEVVNMMNRKRLQRHVGIVYRPYDEMDSHYTYTHLADQFDAVIFTDTTTALKLLIN